MFNHKDREDDTEKTLMQRENDANDHSSQPQ
jgi:hypothetical protein